jgi:hypothetical protein
MEKGETPLRIKKRNKTRDCARRKKKSLCVFFCLFEEKYIKRKKENFIWKNKTGFFFNG